MNTLLNFNKIKVINNKKDIEKSISFLFYAVVEKTLCPFSSALFAEYPLAALNPRTGNNFSPMPVFIPLSIISIGTAFCKQFLSAFLTSAF